MKRYMRLFLIPFLTIALVLTSCGSNKKTQGAIIGATLGGAAGAVLTKDNKAVGIIIGAAIGGVAGGVIGNYMDKAARDIEDDLGEKATVTRIGEGLVVSFDSGLLFDFDSDELRSVTKVNLAKLAESLKEYDQTEVNVLGHTDSRGSEVYNLNLSKERAGSVQEYLVAEGIDFSRISINGYGESDPVATNETAEGRQQNRRVEIVLVADESLKQQAKSGALTIN